MESDLEAYIIWYPPLRSSLLCLSKLYGCVDPKIFNGLAQDAVHAATASVQVSSISQTLSTLRVTSAADNIVLCFAMEAPSDSINVNTVVRPYLKPCDVGTAWTVIKSAELADVLSSSCLTSWNANAGCKQADSQAVQHHGCAALHDQAAADFERANSPI